MLHLQIIFFHHFLMTLKQLLRLTGIPVLLASMCCLSPLIFFLLWIVSLSVATELAELFYGTYKWVFRWVGLLSLVWALWWYFYTKGVCTLDAVKKQRKKVINTILLVFSVWILAYIFFLYIVVHYIGVWLDIWK